MLSTAFGKKERDWFAIYRPQIFQRSAGSVRCHRIVTDRKGIAGVIGIYPLRFRVGRAVLNVGGVGSVAVRRDQRGRGLMSSMFRQTIRELEREGCDISWLGGPRFRYALFGWDHGGRHVRFTVSRRNVRRWMPGLGPCAIRPVRHSDTPVLRRLYATLGSGVVRSACQWPVLLDHAEYVWEITSDRRAYLAAFRWGPDQVAEVAGAPRSVAGLLEAHARRWKLERRRVNTPQSARQLDSVLFRIADDFAVQHNHQVRVVNVQSTWRKLAPEIARQARAAGNRDARTLLRVRSPGDQALILRRALGFMDSVPPFPASLSRFEWVRPVGWWMSYVDGV